MPRSGPLGTYTLPPIYLAIPGTTIVVDQHNLPLQDIATTFNTPTPITYGGTGQATAAAALAALGGVSSATLFYTTALGTKNAITVDPTVAVPTLATGRYVTFTAAFDNDDDTTINVSGLGDRKLLKATPGGASQELAPSNVVAGGKYEASFDAALDNPNGAWILENPTPFYGDVRNRLVNPAMQISTVNANTAGTTNGYAGADNWATAFVTSAGTFTTQRVQSRTPHGSTDRYRVTITAADASLAAGEFLTVSQNILGNEVADFLYGAATAKQTVLTFGWKSPAGTYSIALRNAALNRTYVAQFTPAAANTDEYISLVIPGDVTGTWGTGTGTGVTVSWTVAAGSTFQGAAGWQAGNFLGTATNTNGAGTINNVFELYDVQFTLDQDNLGVSPTWELPSPIAAQNALAVTGRILLLSGTASAVSSLDVVLTSFLGYFDYTIEIDNYHPATDGSGLNLLFSTNGGSSYDNGAANYQWAIGGGTPAGYAGDGSASDTRIALATNIGNTNPARGASFTVQLKNPASTSEYTKAIWHGGYVANSGTGISVAGWGQRLTAQDTDAIRLISSSGNITKLEYRVYGNV